MILPLISSCIKSCVLCFILDNSPASEFYMPTFRNTLLFHLHMRVDISSYLPAYEDGTAECSEMLAYKIQTSGNYPKESIQHSEHGESSKSRKLCLFMLFPNIFKWFITFFTSWFCPALCWPNRTIHPDEFQSPSIFFELPNGIF